VFQLQHIQAYGLSKTKEKKETKKYYKYNKVRHLIKNCKSEQNIKNRSIQEESDKENNSKQEGFVGDLE